MEVGLRDARSRCDPALVRMTQLVWAALVLMSSTSVTVIEAQKPFDRQACAIESFPGQPQRKPFERDLHRVGDKGVTPPTATRQRGAQYTVEAMEKKIEGCVVIEAVVEVDGKVRRYRVIRSLEESLDMAATEALQKWEFVPGTFQGTPIPVVVFVEMTFSLRE